MIFRIRPEIERILFGLGFSRTDLDRPVSDFSGGWIMRLLLAKLLLNPPSLLLLDEPTNHLDLDSLTWMEDFLLQYQGAMVIISHDRAFLRPGNNKNLGTEPGPPDHLQGQLLPLPVKRNI